MKGQNENILLYLKSGKSLTPLEALHKFGSLRLGARIFQLKQAGYNIKSEMIETNSGKRVAQYTLIQGLKQTTLFDL